MKILVGVPLYQENQIHPVTNACLKSLDEYSKKSDAECCFETVRVCGTSSLFARNYAAAYIGKSQASELTWQKPAYDFFFSTDGDMGFSAESILRLTAAFRELKALKKFPGIVGGAYSKRNSGSHLLVSGKFEIPGKAPANLWLPYWSHGLQEVDWCGTGSMLVPRETLESMPYPWFRSYIVTKNDASTMTTEDLSICMDVKQKGLSVWVDCDNRFAHFPHY